MKMRDTHSNGVLESDISNTITPLCRYQRCNKEFISKRRWQKFCSPECKDQYWNQLRKEISREIQARTSTAASPTVTDDIIRRATKDDKFFLDRIIHDREASKIV